MNAPAPERMPVAKRGHAVTGQRKKVSAKDAWWRVAEPTPSQFSLIFDCETSVDAAQQHRVGGYQFREGDQLREDGLFYDPQSLSAPELQTLSEYARARDLVLRTVLQFNEEVLLGLAYQRNAHIVGFNLPFDVSRIAIGHDSARRRMRGGFTFKLSEDERWPHLQIKHLSRTAALIRFAGVEGSAPSARRASESASAG